MSEKLRVLLVEDSPTDEKLVVLALRTIGREVELLRVEEEGRMRAALAAERWDIVISDWSMPRFSAPAALAVLRGTSLDLPFIIVSGTVGEELAVEAMRAGAHDYVLKGNLARLAPAVERELRERDARAARRAADLALQLQQDRFRALIEQSDEGIVLTDVNACLLYASPGARRLLGYESDPVGQSIATTVHAEDRAALMAVAVRLRQSPSASATMEFRVVRLDGATRWLEANLVNRLDDPTVGAVVANFRDITERKAVVDALRESELRFRRIWEAGLVGIGVRDLSGGYIDANDALLDTTGYTREDLRAGMVRVADLTPHEWDETTRAAGEQLRQSGRAKPWEKQYVRKDGTRVPVLVGIASLTESQSISVVVDLSAQKMAEHDRERAEEALHSAEAQLRQAQKMEAIGRLAGGVAHDFNNALSVILSYGELAMKELAPGNPMREDMAEICKAGLRAADLTQQLLMFSRQQVLEPKILDPNEVIVALDKMLRRVLGEDVQLQLVTSRPVGLIRADRSSIEQVIMNLTVNARDAMPTGGQLTIETAALRVDEAFARSHDGLRPGPYVVLTVSDNGAGMDAPTQAHIFEPFFTTKPKGKGTGLGLSTVFGIVHQSGGTVGAQSELGVGTTFRIYLPCVEGGTRTAHTTPVPASDGGNETILLVEDEDQVRVVARGILQRAGYNVLDARNAGEALLLSEQCRTRIHLLLTDVVMPQMSGPVLARRLAETRKDLKLLCMSGYTDDSVVRHGVLESEVAYLQKPFTPDSLTRKVREVLDAPLPG